MIRYMLDSNTCIYLIKRKYPSILERLTQLKAGQVCVSAITVAELHNGVQKSAAVAKNEEALGYFLTSFDVLEFGEEAATASGKIRATLEKAGTPIGSLDMLIAGHAIAESTVLVTHDRDFKRIAGLKIEDWVN
jgi:tRNA(fMet)-specific endonuclease VapC